MKLIKKLAVNVHSRVESLADNWENKEALSSSYIRQYERLIARARVKLARVGGDVARLGRQAGELKAAETLWAERARRVHATEPEKALACVRRMKAAQADRRRVAGELEEARRLEEKMGRDVDHILEKLSELKRRHRALSGRQSCAEAVTAVHGGETGLQAEMDDLLNRWETDVSARELRVLSPTPDTDPLDREFADEEENADLQQALSELIADSPPSKEQ